MSSGSRKPHALAASLLEADRDRAFAAFKVHDPVAHYRRNPMSADSPCSLAGLRSRILTVLLGCAATLLGLEFLVRLVAPQPLQHIQLDDELYFVNRPGSTFTYARVPEYSVPITYNSWGFRGPIPAPNPLPGTTRIVLIGDSQTEGLQVGFDDTYGAVLQRQLEHLLPGRRFEVINLAVSAYGTHQELLTLRRYGSRVRPDWVVLGFYPDNDLGDNVRLPLVVDDQDHVHLVRHRFSFAHRLALGAKIWIASVSHLYVLTIPALKALLSADWLAKVGLIEPLTPTDVTTSMSDGRPSRAYRITEELIRMTWNESQRLGAAFVVLRIPSKPQVLDGPSARAKDMDKLENDFASGFERAGMAHVEVLTDLRRTQQRGAAPFFRDDGHLSTVGHRVIGERLAEWLASRMVTAVPVDGRRHRSR